MKESHIRLLHSPGFTTPIFIAGLPSIGNIGRIVSEYLIDLTVAKIFAELYSPTFQDYILVDDKGICRLLRYEFFAPETGSDLIIMIGDNQPPLEDVPAQYEVLNDVLEFVSNLGCNLIVTFQGLLNSNISEEIFVSATSRRVANEFQKKGTIVYNGNRIVGSPGLMVGLAKKRNLKAVCLLVNIADINTNQESALRINNLLKKVISSNSNS